ncbi:MAG TPA: VOC family protein [Gemmatimonadales bacterium]|jgi:predicted enzyme related to lactoylglutathione lyase|nr:VOC family protein [Gemmatimonadales bacterium]
MAEPQRSAEHDRRIDYIEFPAVGLPATKRFYQEVFGWKFTDYGPDYASFEDGRLDGGFHAGDGARKTTGMGSGALVVLFAVDLADTEARVRRAGGAIVTPPFSFPGGRRFHFTDPSGNELAVWSDR